MVIMKFAYLLLQLHLMKCLWEYIFQRHIRKVVQDGKLRHRLMPDYPIGCKRILISNHWYETLTQPHVDVIDTGIQEITEHGI